MSKMLRAGELGWGLMVEGDAGYISSDLNKDILNEDFKIKPNEPVLVNCILQKWGVKNKNGRIYPKDVLVSQANLYMDLVNSNSAVSEADHPECVSASESMICTKEGWKKFDDILEDEEILTLNINTNQIEIQKIERKIFERYKGKMYKFSGKNLELTVTGNHRFLLENSKGERSYHTAFELYSDNTILSSGKYKILKTGDWSGVDNEFFVLNGVDANILSNNIKHELFNKYTKPINIKSEDWFAFMGIYLSEGHCSGTKTNQYKIKGYDVVITQKKEVNKILIEGLLNKLPFDYRKYTTEHGKTQYHISDARLYEYLFPLGFSHNKFIPIELKQASKSNLKILFDWFLIGDGRSIKSDNNKWSIRESVFTTSKQLIEDLHEILIKIGRNGNITNYQPIDRVINERKIINNPLTQQNEEGIITRLIKSENSHIQYNLNLSNCKHIWFDNRSIKITEIDFDDIIACVTVKNGNFLVKVNGKSHWTGNSSIISLQNISHKITKMWWGKGEQENVLYGQLKLIVSRGYINYGVASVIGDKILLYLENNIRLGISSRGVGTLKEINGENLVQNDFELIGFDLVSTPSTPGAYLFPSGNNTVDFAENYVNKNGIYLKENENKIVTAIDKFLL